MLTEAQNKAITEASAVLRNQPAKATVIVRRPTMIALLQGAQKAQAAESSADYMEKKLRQCGQDLESVSWKYTATRIALACVSVLLLIVLVVA